MKCLNIDNGETECKKIALTSQQINILTQMNNMELKKPIKNKDDNHIYITTTLGILATDPGIGKSIITLEMIKNNLYLPNTNNVVSCNHKIISIYDKNKLHYIHTNIIVASKYTISQWEYYMKTYIPLKYISIQKKKDINYNPFYYNNIDVILITPICYKQLITVINKSFVVSRLIIDDIHVLSMPNTIEINTCFTWLLSSNVLSILYPQGCIINKTRVIPDNYNSFIHKYVLDLYNKKTIQSILIQGKNDNLKKNICYTDIKISIPEKTYYKYPKYKLFVEKCIQYEKYIDIMQLFGIPIYNRGTHEETQCPICYETITDKYVTTDCCKKKFCISCISKYISYQTESKCPTCRSPNYISRIKYYDTSLKDVPLNKLSKENQLIEILKQLKHQKTIVVFQKSSNEYIQSNKNNLIYNSNTDYYDIQNRFSNHKNILFIDHVTIQYGFNLPKIDNIIILDHQPKPIENIIISKTRKYHCHKIHIFNLYKSVCNL